MHTHIGRTNGAGALQSAVVLLKNRLEVVEICSQSSCRGLVESSAAVFAESVAFEAVHKGDCVHCTDVAERGSANVDQRLESADSQKIEPV